MKVNLSVSVDDAHLEQFSEVVRHCKEAGMEVEAVLGAIGVISGTIDASRVGSLNEIEGVAHVEQPREFRLAPPDSPVQ